MALEDQLSSIKTSFLQFVGGVCLTVCQRRMREVVMQGVTVNGLNYPPQFFYKKKSFVVYIMDRERTDKYNSKTCTLPQSGIARRERVERNWGVVGD